MKRPSGREIDNRLKEAKEAVKKNQVAFANFNKIYGELENLGIEDTSEIWNLILKLLNEIEIRHYAGQYPPKSNTEPFGTGSDLWAFHWHSKTLEKEMYLKFSIKDSFFYYVSLHESKFPREGGEK
ncbi:MAG: hypothetical protein WCG10_05845 [Chlamydiota bacterium]